MSELNERVVLIEHWWKGNGTKGAEERLQNVEDKTNSVKNKINVIIILLGILTLASFPDLLKVFGLI